MRRVFRWIGIVIGGLAGLGIVAYAVVYGLSQRILNRQYELPTVALTIPQEPESILEGKRLAIVHGCLNGCHGKEAAGQVFFDQPVIARIVAPNLTAAVRDLSTAQFSIAVRNGIGPDGRSLLIMPAEAYAGMTDADVGRIIAYLQSLPQVEGPGRSVAVGPIGRLGLVSGRFKTVAQMIDETVPLPEAADQQAAFGRYLARTVCAECHGTSLAGASTPDFTSPDLRVVAAYSPEAFARLLRTGVALGERPLGLMGTTARRNLSHLTDAEIAALYSYLHALPPVVVRGNQ